MPFKISQVILTFKMIGIFVFVCFVFFKEEAPFMGNFEIRFNYKQVCFNSLLLDDKGQTTFQGWVFFSAEDVQIGN